MLQEPNRVPCPSHDGFCDAGLADLIVNQIAIEQQNTVTNPLLNAWQDVAKNESTDECRNFFAPSLGGSSAPSPSSGVGNLFNQALGEHNYYLQTAFNLAALKLNYPGVPCLPGIGLQPKFTAPNTVNAGDIVGFDGMESTIKSPRSGCAAATRGSLATVLAMHSVADRTSGCIAARFCWADRGAVGPAKSVPGTVAAVTTNVTATRLAGIIDFSPTRAIAPASAP